MVKKGLAWIVDSTIYMSKKLKSHPDLFSVPLNIHFGDKQYVDGVDLTSEELYQKIKQATQFPKTSQPSAGVFAEKFLEISKEYEEAIAIHLPDVLSGTLASSKGGAKIAQFPVTFIDSLSLSYGTTALVEYGMSMYEKGASVLEIKEKLLQIAGSIENYILIGNLDQLYKGGRMSSVQFFLGSILNIKPIIQISKEGTLEAIDKVRSEKRALQYLHKKIEKAYQKGVQKIYIMHGNIIEKAEQFKQTILTRRPQLDVEIGDISSVLAVHAGEGTLAVLWFDKSKYR